MWSGTVLNCSAIEFWQTRTAGYSLLSKIAIDLISAPESQAYADRLFSICGDLTAGKWNIMAKKTLNFAYFSEWTWSTVQLIMWTQWTVVECLILAADFDSDRYDSERMMMIMMTTTITSNSVSVLYTALLLLLVSNSKYNQDNKNSSGDEIANVNFLRRYRTYFKILKKRTYFV